MQHSRRRWINSCFLFGGGSWGKRFSKNIFGLAESKPRWATSLFNFFFLSVSPFGAGYMYLETDSASEKKWTEGEMRQERANHKSIQPFFSGCLLISNSFSFLQGAKAPRLWSLMLRGFLDERRENRWRVAGRGWQPHKIWINWNGLLLPLRLSAVQISSAWLRWMEAERRRRETVEQSCLRQGFTGRLSLELMYF